MPLGLGQASLQAAIRPLRREMFRCRCCFSRVCIAGYRQAPVANGWYMHAAHSTRIVVQWLMLPCTPVTTVGAATTRRGALAPCQRFLLLTSLLHNTVVEQF